MRKLGTSRDRGHKPNREPAQRDDDQCTPHGSIVDLNCSPIACASDPSFQCEHNNIAGGMSILAALDRQAHNCSVAGDGSPGAAVDLHFKGQCHVNSRWS